MNKQELVDESQNLSFNFSKSPLIIKHVFPDEKIKYLDDPKTFSNIEKRMIYDREMKARQKCFVSKSPESYQSFYSKLVNQYKKTRKMKEYILAPSRTSTNNMQVAMVKIRLQNEQLEQSINIMDQREMITKNNQYYKLATSGSSYFNKYFDSSNNTTLNKSQNQSSAKLLTQLLNKDNNINACNTFKIQGMSSRAKSANSKSPNQNKQLQEYFPHQNFTVRVQSAVNIKKQVKNKNYKYNENSFHHNQNIKNYNTFYNRPLTSQSSQKKVYEPTFQELMNNI